MRLRGDPDRILLALPFAVAMAGVVSALLGKAAFKWLTAEDGAAENLQVLAFAASAWLALLIGFRLRARGRYRLAALYLAAGAGLFFVVGEEVSWGQRLLGLQTPEPLEELNRQGEITLHNVFGVEDGFDAMQFLLGAMGTLAPLALLRWPSLGARLRLPRWMLPPPTLAAYMVFPFVWRAFRAFAEVPHRYRFVVAEYGEVVELNLALGILLALAVQYRSLRAEERAVPLAAAPPPLPYVLASVERAGIAYCLLRDEKKRESGEVDLLVAPEQLGRLSFLLRRFGYLRTDAPGHAPHHFFVASRASGSRARLDVITDLRFGRPIRALRVGDARACLQHRTVGNQPRPDDAFVLLLLHCLLDKAHFAPRHAARLATLLRELRSRPAQLAAARKQVERWLAPALSWELVERSVAEGRWAALLARRRRLVRQVFWRAPAASAARIVAGRLARRFHPLLEWEPVAATGTDGPARPPASGRPLHVPHIYKGTNVTSGEER